MINHFRVARHTNDILRIREFYIEILGLKLLGEFDHKGYKGAFIGEENQNWHLEFTESTDLAEHILDGDDLLVFYLGKSNNYSQLIERLESKGYLSVPSKNPYWDEWGRTYCDPDGFRIVVSFRGWSND